MIGDSNCLTCARYFCCWLHRQIRMLPRTLSQWTMLVWAMFTISRLQETHSRTCCSIVREGTSCLSSRSSDKSNGVLIRFQLAFITFQHTIHAEECAEERNRYEIDLRSIRWGELWKWDCDSRWESTVKVASKSISVAGRWIGVH